MAGLGATKVVREGCALSKCRRESEACLNRLAQQDTRAGKPPRHPAILQVLPGHLDTHGPQHSPWSRPNRVLSCFLLNSKFADVLNLKLWIAR